MQYIFFHIDLVLKTFSHEQMQMQNMLTALPEELCSCRPVSPDIS